MTRHVGFMMSLAVLAGVVVTAQAQHSSKESTTIRSGVDVVALTVTVTDTADKYVTGLTGQDFTVLEDGIPQPLSFFATGHVPLDLAFVLDTSGSMLSELALAQKAACGLAHTLRPGDRGSVVDIKQGVRMPQGLTEDVSLIETAIRGTRSGGDTALNDGLYIVLKEFQKQRRENQEIRRQVIVVLSDGQDNASHVEFDEVLELARRIGASIYIISLTKPSTLPPRMVNFQYLTRVAYSMKALAREVGGRIFQPTQASQLPQVYGAIASELANQYELGYVPSNLTRDGGYRRIAVRVTRDDASVRTRTGYFADGSGFQRHSIDPQD